MALVMLLLSPAVVLAESPKIPATEIYVELQKRNFAPTVEFCKKMKPELQQLFKQYLENYSRGVDAGFMKIDDTDKWHVKPPADEINQMYKMASIQGENIKKRFEMKPEVGCARVYNLFSNFTSQAAEQQVLRMYKEYQAKSAQYCSQVPKPENCH